jgi:hypothetical protein
MDIPSFTKVLAELKQLGLVGRSPIFPKAGRIHDAHRNVLSNSIHDNPHRNRLGQDVFG